MEPALLGLVLRQGAALAGLAAASWLIGAWVVDRLPLRRGAERYAFATAAGLGALALLCFVLGVAGALHPIAIGVATTLAALGALVARRRRRRSAEPVAPGDQRGDILLLAVLLIPTFVFSLYPPQGFDETVYHLPFAAAFADNQRLVLLPELIFPILPQLLDVLFGALVATAGDTASHTVQFLCLIASTAAVYGAADRFAGRPAALLAAAIWLSNPMVHYQAGTAYVDLGFALFALLAAVGWEIGLSEGRRGWMAAAGAFAGLAAGTKHVGLVWAALLTLGAVLCAPRGRRWRSAFIFAAAAGVTLAPFYARLYYETGNPVFPMLPDLFPATGSRLERASGVPLAAAGRLSVPRLVDWLLAGWRGPVWTLPWDAAFNRARFNFQAPLSPYYLGLLPLLAWQAWRDRRLRRWLVLVVAYALLWSAHDPRFQLPSAALLAVGGGIAVTRLLARPGLWSGLQARRLTVAALLLAAPGSAYAAWKVVRQGAPPATAAARSRYLERALSGYTSVELLNRACGSSYTLYGINVENLDYYVHGRFLGHRTGPFRQGQVAPLLDDPRALHAALAGWRVDYLLVKPYSGERRTPGPAPPVLDDPDAASYFRAVPARGAQLFEVLDGHGGRRAACRVAP